jgi:O-antigen ligase
MRRALTRAWRVQPAWVLSLGVAATAFSGHWSRLGLPPIDRLLLFAGFALVVLRAGSEPDLPPLRWRRIHLLLLAVVGYALVSAFAAHTLSQHVPRFALIDRLGAVPFAAFVVAPSAFATPRQREILIRVLVVLGLYLGITAICEGAKLNGLVWPRYILDPTYGIHQSRARGPFVEAEANGLAMLACGVAAAIALGIWRDRVARLAAWAAIGVCGIGIMLTYTRLVWIGAGAGVLVALVTFPGLRWRAIPVMAVGAGAVALGIALVPGLQHDLSARYHESQPTWTRRTTDAAAVRMIAAKPVLGWGWGTYPKHAVDYFRTIEDIRMTGQGEDVHNVFLSRFVELGLVGGGLWLISVLLAIGGALVRPRSGDRELVRRGFCVLVVADLVAAMLSPLSALFPLLILWLWAGTLWVPVRHAVRHPAAAAVAPV